MNSSNTPTNRTPVTIITGFLGSGKTSLLRQLLAKAREKRIAVIENEFGEVSIDDLLLADTNQTILEMTNGCLCCTSNGNLIQTLLSLVGRRTEFDHLIIETTGIANPLSVAQTFILNEDISEAFKIDAIITTVDAKHLDTHIRSKECQQQIALADIVLLNKLDLIDKTAAKEVERKVNALNALATVYKTEHSEIAVSQVLCVDAFSGENLPSPKENHQNSDNDPTHQDNDEESCNHAHNHEHTHDENSHDHLDSQQLHSHNHDEFLESVGIETTGTLERSRFNSWFSELIRNKGADLYRCKAVLAISGETHRIIVQSVHQIVEVNTGSLWQTDTPVCKIVFIGKNLDRSEITSDFKNCLTK